MPRYEIEVIHKAVSVLRVLADSETECGASEIARRIGLGRSSTFRLLYTLQQEGMVRQDPHTRRYRLGPELSVLGRAASDQFELRREARPHMEALTAQTGLPTFLNVPGTHDVICVEHVTSLNTIELYGRVGHTLPYHACPSGYVLLAYGPSDRLDRVLASRLPTFGPNTPHAESLLRIVADTRSRGYASARDDLEEGVSSLAVPITDPTGETIAALGIAGFSHLVDPRLDDLAAKLQATARAISASSSPPVPPPTERPGNVP